MTEFDPNFGSALEAAAAINARRISSVELTRHVFERIDKFQPKLNAFVYQMREQALASARRADEAAARKDKRPPFAGVPVVVKESFAVAGRPCTWGITALKNTSARANSTAVQRLLDAGAILIGATHVPFNSGTFRPTTRSTAPPTTPGTWTERRAARLAAQPRRWQPGSVFSVLAATSAVAFARLRTFAASSATSRLLTW